MSKRKHPGIVIRSCEITEDGTRREVPTPQLPSEPPSPRTSEHTLGTVQDWHPEEGSGVIASDRTPGGCWVHYSDVAGRGFRTLTAGQDVALEFEDLGAKYPGGNQDGYRYRAISVTGK
ncbi:cold shock domain-containing protein [Rhodococcus sp. G-MC3]|uniref:cold-shock protein n=1 Tax=Rhodococcus sp. G-MC3 TaxID=3046209 RepID=UPI0024BB5B2A|nr:cold shock domain-containing protein [Rhodococcus sp. G-MC3]MDJ0396189.1 cold shock domain-containing protein [Rhodococcus sp. G-MC3]